MDDDETMRILRGSLRAAPASMPGTVPSLRAIEDAVSAGRWIRMDDEFAELVADSADHPISAGVRGSAGAARMLTYRLDDLTLECELATDALWGQAIWSRGAPNPLLKLELVTPDGGVTPMDLDAEGRFLLQRVPPGPVGIRCIREGRPRAMTPWFLG
ncbi:MAG TPA: hypothetical protein VI357_24800 [Mycobacteriales bacterium]